MEIIAGYSSIPGSFEMVCTVVDEEDSKSFPAPPTAVGADEAQSGAYYCVFTRTPWDFSWDPARINGIPWVYHGMARDPTAGSHIPRYPAELPVGDAMGHHETLWDPAGFHPASRGTP